MCAAISFGNEFLVGRIHVSGFNNCFLCIRRLLSVVMPSWMLWFCQIQKSLLSSPRYTGCLSTWSNRCDRLRCPLPHHRGMWNRLLPCLLLWVLAKETSSHDTHETHSRDKHRNR
ncbi:uncharacterized protein [Haliotis asinina]|uniref:uncharacterized protein n=1 Tax=Haliotis asinina TaxID=109174 RepID=UPI00353231AA